MALDYEIYDLGDFRFQRGATVRSCKLAYKVFGKLNVDKNNVIVYPTWYSGQHYDNEWLIGSGMALDPDKYFIIIPNMFGNGLSSSPSNTPEPYNGPRFPQVTACDNVRAQHRLVTEKFGVRNVKLLDPADRAQPLVRLLLIPAFVPAGVSRRRAFTPSRNTKLWREHLAEPPIDQPVTTFHWGALYPDMVERILPFCDPVQARAFLGKRWRLPSAGATGTHLGLGMGRKGGRRRS